MKIAVLGTGTMGMALSRTLAKGGHGVVVGSREPARAADCARSLGGGVRGASAGEAVASSELCVLAVRWADTPEMLSAAGNFGGRVLIDATNPESADGQSLAIGHTTSGAERISQWALNARVVKAFNSIYAEALESGGEFDRERASIFFCGDDSDAKDATARLVEDLGFEPIDAGGLQNARFLEPAAALMVQLVRVQGYVPGNVALKLLTRDEGRACG